MVCIIPPIEISNWTAGHTHSQLCWTIDSEAPLLVNCFLCSIEENTRQTRCFGIWAKFIGGQWGLIPDNYISSCQTTFIGVAEYSYLRRQISKVRMNNAIKGQGNTHCSKYYTLGEICIKEMSL